MIPDETSRGLGIGQKKWPIIYFFSDDFWVKEPRHSENIFAKKRYNSTVVALVRILLFFFAN